MNSLVNLARIPNYQLGKRIGKTLAGNGKITVNSNICLCYKILASETDRQVLTRNSSRHRCALFFHVSNVALGRKCLVVGLPTYRMKIGWIAMNIWYIYSCLSVNYNIWRSCEFSFSVRKKKSFFII